MYKFLIIFVLYQLFSMTIILCQENSQCITPTELDGICINIKNCPPLIEALRRSKQNPNYRELLQQSRCGQQNRDVLVCCPGQAKPDQPKQKEAMTQQTYPLPSADVCGSQAKDAELPRIVGGFDVNAGQFPWVVALGYSESRSEPNWLCGGTIITQRHILSAAHCIRDDLYIVRYGTLNIHTDPYPRDVLVEEARRHEQYDATYISNDISIIKVAEDIQFTDTPLVRPICLPVDPPIRNMKFERTYPFVAGWGSLWFNGPSSDRLQGLQLPIVTNAQCKNKFANFKSAVIDDRVICAGFTKGSKDSCRGDSGGPLMWPYAPPGSEQKQIKFFQIGVISYGYRCAEPGFPGVYVRVTQYIDWILSKLY
ncbi:venom protease-like [Chrysoperla carnea]|uniref:venom protease-like n=1 Tax=Chrysoperla carnea TaxID=189513 RepID=UPI001D060ECC|nr:venom protease-like [Chrysoperla carnea]